nr:MAG: MC137L [Molluscum contagiosum virus]
MRSCARAARAPGPRRTFAPWSAAYGRFPCSVNGLSRAASSAGTAARVRGRVLLAPALPAGHKNALLTLVIRTRCLRWLPDGGEECERRQSVLIFPF